MSNFFKILPLVFLSGWLTGYPSADLYSSYDSHLTEADSSHLAVSDAGTILPSDSTPLLPAALQEPISEHLQEIEPDTNRQLAKFSGRDLLSIGSYYLRHSGRTGSFQLVRKLIFPFHIHL